MRRTKYFPFTGGENLVEPVTTMKPGQLQDSFNYFQKTDGGYERIGGYEKFDGRTDPVSLDRDAYATEALWIAAMDAARAAIQAVPGAGPIRGIFVFEGDVYAFRNNLGETACVLHKATASGWSEVSMDHVLPFDSGTNEISEGDTITGNTSGASAVVTHIHVDSGGWGTNNAVGEIHFNPSTLTNGPFTNGETIKVGPLNSATATADSSAETFPAGGSVKTILHNFYGLSDRREIYGVNGVGKAWSFDGSDVRFIHTGMTDDTPNHIYAHKKQLFLSFPGGSVQHSVIGDPYDWSGLLGAAELGIGDDCTGFAGGPEDTLIIFARNSIHVLYGSDTNDWNLTTYSHNTGGYPRSVQNMGQPFFLDDRGLRSLSTTQAYGDFRSNTWSQLIQPRIDAGKGSFVTSLSVRDKDQMRLFYDDGTILCFSFNKGKVIGATRLDYGYFVSGAFTNKIMSYAISVENSDGEEELYAGDDDGMVYRLDHGNSFAGQTITAYIKPVFHHFGSPENIKRFMKMTLEIDTQIPIDLSFTPEYSHGEPFYPPAVQKDITIQSGVGVWGQSYWESFYWDSQSLASAFGYFLGVGRSCRVTIKSEATYEPTHTLQGVIFHYSLKGIVK